MRDIKVASVQFEHADGGKQTNLEVIKHYTAQAAREQCEIICFPECCVTGYWYLKTLTREQLDHLAEPIPNGSACQTLLALSQTHGITIGAGLVERAEDGKLYNAYIVAMPDGTYKCHRKLHTFIHPEISSGNDYTVFDTPHGCRVGVLICYDNNLIENARMNAIMGAEILLSPHQTGGCDTVSPHAMGLVDKSLWENRHNDPEAIEAEFKGDKGRGWLMRWLPARAHDNGLFLIFSNGVGRDGDEIRTGNAMILDPYGRVLNETWKAQNQMITATLEAELQPLSSGRRWLKARRPELYTPLTQPTGQEQNIRQVRFGDQS